jgi:hypothetical protein
MYTAEGAGIVGCVLEISEKAFDFRLILKITVDQPRATQSERCQQNGVYRLFAKDV